MKAGALKEFSFGYATKGVPSSGERRDDPRDHRRRPLRGRPDARRREQRNPPRWRQGARARRRRVHRGRRQGRPRALQEQRVEARGQPPSSSQRGHRRRRHEEPKNLSGTAAETKDSTETDDKEPIPSPQGEEGHEDRRGAPGKTNHDSGGLAIMAATPDLRGKLEQVNETIEGKRSDAQAKWKAFEQAATSSRPPATTPTARTRRVQEGRGHPPRVRSGRRRAQGARGRPRRHLLDARQDRPPRRGGQGVPPRGQARAGRPSSFGERAVDSDEYKALLDSGVLTSEHAGSTRRSASAAMSRSSRRS
jgi:hypothetical protein